MDICARFITDGIRDTVAHYHRNDLPLEVHFGSPIEPSATAGPTELPANWSGHHR